MSTKEKVEGVKRMRQSTGDEDRMDWETVGSRALWELALCLLREASPALRLEPGVCPLSSLSCSPTAHIFSSDYLPLYRLPSLKGFSTLPSYIDMPSQEKLGKAPPSRP